jgi:hypothetical protein
MLGWRGGFLLSAAEQYLKLELTKNFRVGRLNAVSVGLFALVQTITTCCSTGHPRPRAVTAASRERLELCILAAIRWQRDNPAQVENCCEYRFPEIGEVCLDPFIVTGLDTLAHGPRPK